MWQNFPAPFCNFWRVLKAACGLTLSCCCMMSFLLNLAGLFLGLLSLSSCWKYFSEFRFSFGFKSSKCIGPRMFHHIHKILLFRVKFGLEVEGPRFSGFTICPFPYDVFVGNSLFIPSYHPVQEGLDFVPSKQRCAYDDSIIQLFSFLMAEQSRD
jgi:hypothetical protein